MTYTATYSPKDNKLRLYSSTRLARELYARVRGAGFIYAPKQELFVAPMWTPEREDLLIESWTGQCVFSMIFVGLNATVMCVKLWTVHLNCGQTA
jgi:hypothetical protein